MKKQILMALALVVGTAGAAGAQTITASASIAKVINNTATRNLVFAEATPGVGSGVTVDATATAANAAGPQMGYAEYSYNTASQVDVTVPAVLTHTDGLNTLMVSFTCGVADASATGLTLGGCATHSLPYVAATGGLQVNRLWMGGSILQAAIDGAAAGSYSATVSFTASTL